jgi:hypothetical protein
MNRFAVWAFCCGASLAVAPALADEVFCPACYAGMRLGPSRSFIGSGYTTAGLNQQGYDVNADVHSKSLGGAAYLGYEFLPGAGVELGYLRLGSGKTSLTGTVANSAVPVTQAAARVIAGYGNAVQLAFRMHLKLVTRLYLDSRESVYFWDSDTKVGAGGGQTHTGVGESVGAGLSYQLWRGLYAGGGVDIYSSNSSSQNRFVQYTGLLEWRFGGR